MWYLQRPQRLPKFDLARLKDALGTVDRALAESTYGVLNLQDGVVLLQKGVSSQPATLAVWKQFRQQLPL